MVMPQIHWLRAVEFWCCITEKAMADDRESINKPWWFVHTFTWEEESFSSINIPTLQNLLHLARSLIYCRKWMNDWAFNEHLFLISTMRSIDQDLDSKVNPIRNVKKPEKYTSLPQNGSYLVVTVLFIVHLQNDVPTNKLEIRG